MGRKRIDPEKKRKNYIITMSNEEHEILKIIGDGKFSRGLKKIMTFFLENKQHLK